MSTHEAHSLPFSIASEANHQPCRLLELPAELLQLITLDAPPNLQFKSSEGPLGHHWDATAVLCTPDKTYRIRQVNHSNSVYITRPSQQQGENGIEAVTQPTFTLELTHEQHVSATTYLKSLLPVYASTGYMPSSNQTLKAEVFSNIPLSQRECEQGWRNLACFQLDNLPGSFRPSAAAREQAWHTILERATASQWNLTVRLTRNQGALLVITTPLEDLESGEDFRGDDLPPELFGAVLRAVADEVGDGEMQIDAQRCARWVGLTVLENLCQTKGTVSRTDFVERWKDLLPEAWREEAQMEILAPNIQMDDIGIRFVDDDQGARSSTGAEAKSTLGAKRKWHEKFREQKKAS